MVPLQSGRVHTWRISYHSLQRWITGVPWPSLGQLVLCTHISLAFLPCQPRSPKHPLNKVNEAGQSLKQAKSKPYFVLSYCNNITMLSPSPDAHQAALFDVDHKCSHLDLHIRPDKCVSYIFDGKKTHNRTSFNLQKGPTRHITSAPTKFLGQIISKPPNHQVPLCQEYHWERVESPWRNRQETYHRRIQSMDLQILPGPSLVFNLTVERIPKSKRPSPNSKLEQPPSSVSWTSHAVQHWPNASTQRWQTQKGQTEAPCTGLCIPERPHPRPTKPKPFQHEARTPCSNHHLLNALSVQSVLRNLNTTLIRNHCHNWKTHLESLSVQSKLLDIVQLEQPRVDPNNVQPSCRSDVFLD